MKSEWRCCGRRMYVALTDYDDDDTPVHVRRCDRCGRSVETEERVLRSGSFELRADSKRARNRRYEQHALRTCKVCEGTYSGTRGGYSTHITKPKHQRALAKRRRANHWKQVESQRRYRERMKDGLRVAA